MPKQTVNDVFGEILEKGTTSAQISPGGQKKPSDGGGGLDWLEKSVPRPQPKPAKQSDMELERAKQIRRLSEQDKQRSIQAYRQIQEQIQMLRRKKAGAVRKYETGKAEFDDEQIKDPEAYFEKMEKRKEEASKSLPLSSKQGMGTGEVRRGVSG